MINIHLIRSLLTADCTGNPYHIITTTAAQLSLPVSQLLSLATAVVYLLLATQRRVDDVSIIGTSPDDGLEVRSAWENEIVLRVN